jgi:hypothetical protein
MTIIVGDYWYFRCFMGYCTAMIQVVPSRMLKNSASIVLAALRGPTYRSVRLASSRAAALLDRLFEHPAGYSSGARPYRPWGFLHATTVFFATY